MMNKRGQLSIETLILYGLIVLVALSAVGALIYFNVLDLGGYLPDTCNIAGTGDLKCEEFRANPADNTVSLSIRNIGQKTITKGDNAVAFTIDDQENTHFTGTVKTTMPSAWSLAPGAIKEVKFTIPSSDGELKSGATLRATITAEYVYAGGVIDQGATGDLRIRVP